MRCARKAATCFNLRQGGHEELKERLQKKLLMTSKIDPETIKIQTPGAVLEPSGDPVVLGSLGALLEISGAIWWKNLEKLGRRWTQDGQKIGQVGGKLRPRWAMIAPR